MPDTVNRRPYLDAVYRFNLARKRRDRLETAYTRTMRTTDEWLTLRDALIDANEGVADARANLHAERVKLLDAVNA